MQAAPVGGGDSARACAADPPPSNWDQVPREDHRRLNDVLLYWHQTHGGVQAVDLLVEETQYAWRIYLDAMMMVNSNMLDNIQHQAHVINVECDMRARSAGHNHGAVVIWVRTAGAETSAGVSVPIDGGARLPPGGAPSHTEAVMGANAAQLGDMLADARAAARSGRRA